MVSFVNTIRSIPGAHLLPAIIMTPRNIITLPISSEKQSESAITLLPVLSAATSPYTVTS